MDYFVKKLHIGSNHDPTRSNENPYTNSAMSSASPSCAADQRPVSGRKSGTAPLASPSTSTSTSPASNTTVPVPSSAVSGANRANYISSEKDQIRAATLLSLGGHRSALVTDKDEVSVETLSRQYWVSFLVVRI
jgi:hypothetical protein